MSGRARAIIFGGMTATPRTLLRALFALSVSSGLALASACSTRQTARDAGHEDAATPVDAASQPDARAIDAAAPDAASIPDAATPDATAPDAASRDGGGADAASMRDAPASCLGAIAIAVGDTLDGTTVGAGDDLEPGGSHCPSASADGNDVLYQFHAETSGTFRFEVMPTGSSFDPMLYVVADCVGSACVDGTVLNGPGERETLDVTASAGDDVFLVVDGELFSEGAYRLSLAAL